jgi:hypothetical protein
VKRTVVIPLALSSLAILVVATLLTAQELPAMSPEVRRLGYFLGRWQFETVTDASHDPSGMPVVSIQDNEWLEGTSFLVMRPVEKSSLAASAKLTVLGYDPKARAYTADFFVSPDVRIFMTGLVTGSRWTWLSQDGQLRHTIQVLSPSAYTFQFARSRGTIGWQVLTEGKAVKIIR